MNTLIRFRCKLEEPQRAFLGPFPDENIYQIYNDPGPFVFEAMKKVLSCKFLENEDKYLINTDITSWFLVSLLDLRGQKVNMLILLRQTFKEVYLGYDIDVIVHV